MRSDDDPDDDGDGTTWQSWDYPSSFAISTNYFASGDNVVVEAPLVVAVVVELDIR